MNVRAQSLTTMAPRLQVQGTDANLGKSKRILNAMSRRVMTNQLVMVLVRAPLHMPQYNAAGVLENVRRAQARLPHAAARAHLVQHSLGGASCVTPLRLAYALMRRLSWS